MALLKRVLLAIWVLGTPGLVHAQPSPTYMREWGSFGAGPGQFSSPLGIAADPNADFVYVADTGNNRIQKFTDKGAFVGQWGQAGSTPGEFASPSGIAVDHQGRVYVSDTENDRVQIFDLSGNFLSSFGSTGNGPGKFHSPAGITVDAQDTVYVVDSGNDRIQRFAPDGSYISSWGSKGSVDGKFQSPWGIACVRLTLIAVSDRMLCRTSVFSTRGDFLYSVGSAGAAEDQFQDPCGIAPRGRDIVVADAGNNRMQGLNVSVAGAGFCLSWGAQGTGPGQFNAPRGVATDKHDGVFVLDTGNNRVQKFFCEGDSIVWANPSGGNWSDASNWSDGRVPSECDLARIDLPGTYTVVVDSSAKFSNLIIGSPIGAQTLAGHDVQLAGDLEVVPNAQLDLDHVSVGASPVCPDFCNDCVTGGGGISLSSFLLMRNTGLSAPGQIHNSGVIECQGLGNSIFASGFLSEGFFNDREGTLRTEGHVCCGGGYVGITGTTTNEGSIQVAGSDGGISSGSIEFHSDFHQLSDGDLQFDLQGPGDSGHGVFRADQLAQLAGGLGINFTNGFLPQDGDRFPLIKCQNRQGEFERYSGLSTPNGLYLTPVYDDTSVVLVATSSPVGIDQTPPRSLELSLSSANPGRPPAAMVLRLPSASHGTLAVMDVRGRSVRTIFHGALAVGSHSFTWDGLDAGGRPAPSGMYFVRWAAQNAGTIEKWLLLK